MIRKMIQRGPVWVPNGSPGRVVGASRDYWVPLGSPGGTRELFWPLLGGGFSGDVSFSLGHMFFNENTAIVLEGV